MSFLIKTCHLKRPFCANGHAQLYWFCHVLQSNILNVYHFSISFISTYVHLSLSAWHQLWRLSRFQQSAVPLQFSLPDMVVIDTDATSNNWAFYFQGSGCPISLNCMLWSGSRDKVHIALQTSACCANVA